MYCSAEAGYCSIRDAYLSIRLGYWKRKNDEGESEPSGLPESGKRTPKAPDVLVLKQQRCFAFPTPMF